MALPKSEKLDRDEAKIAAELAEARRTKSYRDRHATWEDFCRDEYGISGEWGRLLSLKAAPCS